MWLDTANVFFLLFLSLFLCCSRPFKLIVPPLKLTSYFNSVLIWVWMRRVWIKASFKVNKTVLHQSPLSGCSGPFWSYHMVLISTWSLPRYRGIVNMTKCSRTATGPWREIVLSTAGSSLHKMPKNALRKSNGITLFAPHYILIRLCFLYQYQLLKSSNGCNNGCGITMFYKVKSTMSQQSFTISFFTFSCCVIMCYTKTTKNACDHLQSRLQSEWGARDLKCGTDTWE